MSSRSKSPIGFEKIGGKEFFAILDLGNDLFVILQTIVLRKLPLGAGYSILDPAGWRYSFFLFKNSETFYIHIISEHNMRLVRFVLFILVVLVFADTNVFGQASTITLQNPIPSTAPLHAAVNVGTTLYVAGHNGTFLKSTDGGTDWLRQTNAPLAVTNKLLDMAFTSASTGYVVGYDTSTTGVITPIVYTTIDAGLSLSSSTSGIGSGARLYRTFFSNASDGWVVGSNASGRAAIYFTNNSAANWTALTSGITTDNAVLSGVCFSTVKMGWVVGTDRQNPGSPVGLIYRTTNQGTTWNLQSATISGNYDFRGVWFLNSDTGYVVGQNTATSTAVIFTTTNAGITWSQTAQGTYGTGTVLHDVKFLPSNPSFGFAVGDSVGVNGNFWSVLTATSNGGFTWVRQDQNNTPGLTYAVGLGSSQSAWAVGNSNNQTSLVENYIGYWYQESQSIGANVINSIFMQNDVGYAIGTPSQGNQPMFFQSQNNGFSWQSSPFLTNASLPIFTTGANELNSFNNPSSGVFWVAGVNNGSAALYETTNSGNSWFLPQGVFTPAPSSEFFGLAFQSIIYGYAVGTQNGRPVIYLSIDAGADWSQDYLGGTTGQLNSAAGEPVIGLTVGYTGTVASPTMLVLTTINDGTSWNTQSPGAGMLNSVYAESNDSIWIAGTSGGNAYIAMTSNAGHSAGFPSWTTPYSMPSDGATIKSIYFITSQIGYAVGTNKTGGAWLIETNNGGQTWTKIAEPELAVGLNSVTASLSDQVDFWAAGSHEAIFHGTVQVPLSYGYPANSFVGKYRTIQDTASTFIALANIGTAPLNVNLYGINWSGLANNDPTIPGDYILDPRLIPSFSNGGVLTIQPGIIDSMKVIFHPRYLNSGIRVGTLNIPSNSARGDTMKYKMIGNEDSSNIQFGIAAFGQLSPLSMHNDTVIEGSFTDDTLYISDYSPFAVSRLNIKSLLLTGQNPTEYSFPNLTVDASNDSASITVQPSSTGTDTFVITFNQPIPVNDVDTLIVRFTPTGSGYRLARLIFLTDGGPQSDSSQVVLLNGFGGCVDETLEGPDTLFANDSATVQGNDSLLTQKVRFCNTCSLPVNILSQGMIGTDQFSYTQLDSLPLVVQPGECDSVTIQFKPLQGATAPTNAQFLVTTNSQTQPSDTVQLSGFACSELLGITQTSFADSVKSDSTMPHLAFLVNNGTCPIVIDSIHFVQGSNGYTFVSISTLAPGTSIPPGGKDSLLVVFKAPNNLTGNIVKGDTENAKITVYSTATNTPMQVVTYVDTVHPDTLTAIREPGFIVNDYSLIQNYPNPFNSSTLIQYSVADMQHVTVEIVNSLGEVIATPVDEIDATGRYQFSFNAANLPNGVYFCRMRAGSHVITNAMTLMK